MPEEKLEIGTEGIALEDIPLGRTGEAYIPKLKKRVRVYAAEAIRKNRDIIIVGANNSATEHTPQELKYETVKLTWERVRETHPLPVTESYVYDDYAEIKFTGEEKCYVIGSAAHKADPSLPESFEAKNLLLLSDQDCWVRFNSPNRVQHFIAANTYFNFHIRCSRIYVVRHVTNGTLKIWSEG